MGLEIGMTIRVTSNVKVAAPLALLSLLLGDAGPALAQDLEEERSRAAVKMCLERAEDVLRDRRGELDIEVDEIAGVDERRGGRMRVQGYLRVIDDDDGWWGAARLDCEVDLSGVDRVTYLDEDGLLRGLDRRRKRDQDRDLGRNGGDAIGGTAMGGDGGEAIAKGGVAIGGRGGDAKGGNAVAIGGRGGDARGGRAAAGRDGGCLAPRGAATAARVVRALGAAMPQAVGVVKATTGVMPSVAGAVMPAAFEDPPPKNEPSEALRRRASLLVCLV
jgi:hypothetical protein